MPLRLIPYPHYTAETPWEEMDMQSYDGHFECAECGAKYGLITDTEEDWAEDILCPECGAIDNSARY